MSELNAYGNDLIRVSTVCDAISRLESDGLVFAGGSWAAKRAIAVAREVFEGTWTPFQKFQELYDKASPRDYLESDWFKKEIQGGVVQMQQQAADRGTLTNLAWDYLWEAPGAKLPHVIDFVEQCIIERAEQVDLAWQEWQDAVDLGLITPKDKDAKPDRKFQAHLEDVRPFVEQLWKWHKTQSDYEQVSSQGYVENAKLGVCGTYDSVGWWQKETVVLDLKTSTSKQPKRSHRAQLSAYRLMLNEEGANIDSAVVLIVTEEGVYPRKISEQGLQAGLLDFNLALSAIKNASMNGSFDSVSKTKKGKTA
jgi:hypothetical protein